MRRPYARPRCICETPLSHPPPLSARHMPRPSICAAHRPQSLGSSMRPASATGQRVSPWLAYPHFLPRSGKISYCLDALPVCGVPFAGKNSSQPFAGFSLASRGKKRYNGSTQTYESGCKRCMGKTGPSILRRFAGQWPRPPAAQNPRPSR